jgi:polygalacturonase
MRKRPAGPGFRVGCALASLVSLGLLCVAPVHSADAGNPATPAVYVATQYGAVGDGVTLDSPAINRAIEAAHAAGGGTVYFPPGTYLSASIHLESRVTLYLEAGATILAVDPSVAKYDAPEPNEWGDRFHYQDYGHSHWKNSLIWGIGLEDVSILGPGLIHGKGLDPGFNRFADESKGEPRYYDNPPGSANKAIALKNCRRVVLRDFSILHGGWFAILATGVDNLTIDNVKLDTNRDGMDIDACRNVRIFNCSVNSPWDDGICLKASYALGHARPCENVTIANCLLSGNYVEGSMLDGTWKRCPPEYRSYRAGRIKLGTESNGDFKNVTISNCVFDDSHGLAIESVDGSIIEDLAVSNLTMRHVSNSPIFIRLGKRARGPEGTPVGAIRRISIDNVVASDSDATLGCLISGIPGHPVEDVHISNLRVRHQGGGTKEWADRFPPENESAYPEPNMFGPTPGYAFFVRHATHVDLHAIDVDYAGTEQRAPFVLDDLTDVRLNNVRARPAADGTRFDLRKVHDFVVVSSPDIPEVRRPDLVERERF